MLWTLQNGDVGRTPGMSDDHEKALRAIEARAIVMSTEKDLYFPPENDDYAVECIPNAGLLRVIPGVWGTLPGWHGPRRLKFIDNASKELLAE